MSAVIERFPRQGVELRRAKSLHAARKCLVERARHDGTSETSLRHAKSIVEHEMLSGRSPATALTMAYRYLRGERPARGCGDVA